MSQLALQNHQATITHYNATTEKHGDEAVPAGDIKIMLTDSNHLLNALVPGMREFLYREASPAERSDLFDQGAGTLTKLAHPNLGAQTLDEDFPGYTVVIESGLGLSEPLALKEVKLTGFAMKALDGGSSTLTFTARVKPSEEQSGKVHYLVKQVVQISLIPPSTSPQQQLPTGGEGDTLSQQDAQDAANEAAAMIEKGKAAA